MQARRAADAAAQLRAASSDPPVAGPDPLSDRLVRARTAEKLKRVEKLLEDAQIKLGSGRVRHFGVSGRQMLAALIDGVNEPQALAQLARTWMRTKIPLLEEAFVGHFTEHHAFLLTRMLARIDETERRHRRRRAGSPS